MRVLNVASFQTGMVQIYDVEVLFNMTLNSLCFVAILVHFASCRSMMQTVGTNLNRSDLSFWCSSIVLQVASVRVIFHPGDLVLADSADGVLHRLVDNCVHRRHKEVQGGQKLLPILGQAPLSIFM